MAIRAGLEYAHGEIACFLACDLQDPPELIPVALNHLVQPVQVVWAVRNSRQDSLPSRLFAGAFYGIARLLVSKNIPPAGASMFVLGSSALKALRSYKERNLTLEGAFATMGFKQAHIWYDRKARQFGKSRWTIAKRLKLFADFFVGYSYAPIRFMSYLGMVVAAFGFLYVAIIVANKLFFSVPVEGWSSLMVIVLLLGGIQMLMMGIIGEYVWRSLDESRSRPRYMIDVILNDSSNFGSAEEGVSSNI
jgi:dolichol-phosphate mannosyltransferase